MTGALLDETRMEEERRLAYVGITRAKKQLILSHARTRTLFNSRSANEMSRFVSEIPPRLINEGTQRGTQYGVPAPNARRGYGESNYSRGYAAQPAIDPGAARARRGMRSAFPALQKGFVRLGRRGR